ncbi:MAG: HEAT repeat domain-containing protein [Planctomycetota bacterium]
MQPSLAFLLSCLALALTSCGSDGNSHRPGWRRRASGPIMRYLSGGEGVGGGGGASRARRKGETPEQQLSDLLLIWGSAVREQQNSILAKIRGDLPRFREPLLHFIRIEGVTLVAAVEVAGRLGIAEAAPYLYGLLNDASPAVRAATIRAMDRLDSWSAEQLAGFLDDPAPQPVVEALAICGEREQPPLLAILDRLADPRPEVQEAAVDALPEELPTEEARKKLLSLASDPTSRGALMAIRAMGVVEEFPGMEPCLLGALRSKNWNLRFAALESLSRLSHPLESTDEVRRLIMGPRVSVEEKVAAFLALERTGSVDRTWVAQMAKNLHPVIKLHAARCLVSVGDASGSELLIELLSAEESQDADDEDVDYARIASQKILAEILGEDLGKDPVAWQESMSRLRKLEPVQIRFDPWKTW